MGVSQNEGYLFGGVPIVRTIICLGSILGYLKFGKLPYSTHVHQSSLNDAAFKRRIFSWEVPVKGRVAAKKLKLSYHNGYT